MIMCPNLKNPEVAREFNELKEATSEQAAYRIWSLNNGNAIDKAPNGAESKLFNNLLRRFGGNREMAIRAKAKLYGQSFIDLFGDWTTYDYANLDWQDENGEPVMSYFDDNNKTSDDEILLHIKKKDIPVIREQILKKNKYITEEAVDEAIAFLDSLENEPESNLYVKTCIRWLKNNSICLPMDNDTVRAAFKLARLYGLDIQNFSNPFDCIQSVLKEKHKDSKSNPINPHEIKEFHFSHSVVNQIGENVEIFDIDETPEGRLAVSQAIADTSAKGPNGEWILGPFTSPWCLATFNYHQDTGKVTRTSSADNHWDFYSADKRLIAFVDGYPIAFRSTSIVGKTEWWSYRDNSYDDVKKISSAERIEVLRDYSNSENRWRNYTINNVDITFMGSDVTHISKNVSTSPFLEFHVYKDHNTPENGLQELCFSEIIGYGDGEWFKLMQNSDGGRFNGYKLTEDWRHFVISKKVQITAVRGGEKLTLEKDISYLTDSFLKLEELLKEFNDEVIPFYTKSQAESIFNINTPEELVRKFDEVRKVHILIQKEITDVRNQLREEGNQKLRQKIKDRKLKSDFSSAARYNARNTINRALGNGLEYGVDTTDDTDNTERYSGLVNDDKLRQAYNRFLHSDEGGYNTLYIRLRQILEEYHILYVEDDLREVFGDDVLGAFDILNKIIYLLQNGFETSPLSTRNRITQVEEFAHAFIELMGSAYHREENRGRYPGSMVYSKLRDEVVKTALYEQTFLEYKDNPKYQLDDGTPDVAKIKKEALGKALATAILLQFEKREEQSFNRLVNYSFLLEILQWFKDVAKWFKDKLTKAGILKIEATIDNVAESILDGTYKKQFLEHISTKGLRDIGYEETMANAPELAMLIMQTAASQGALITGSLSVRKQSPLYRKKRDSMHDIDIMVPLSVGQDFFTMHPRFRSITQVPENYQLSPELIVRDVNNTVFMQRMRQSIPNLQVMYAYSDYEGDLVVNSIVCDDPAIVEKFKSLTGNFASRLKKFNKSERDKIYLVDFFYRRDNDYLDNAIEDLENNLKLANYRASFKAKLKYGRAKDVFDYQRLNPSTREYRVGNQARLRIPLPFGEPSESDEFADVLLNQTTGQLSEINKKPYITPTVEEKSLGLDTPILDDTTSTPTTLDDEITWKDAIDSEIESCQELKQFLQNEADVWVNEQMHHWRSERGIVVGGTMTLEEEELARLDFYKDFYRDRVYEAFDEVLYKLKDMFPVKNNKTGRMRQLFLDRLEHLGPEKAKLMLTIAYNEMIGVKVENNVRPVVHEYIETFHQSDVIQEALRVLDDGRGLSTPRLIRDLVDIITGEITTGNKKRMWNEFWAKFLSKFNRRMKQVFRWIKKKSGGEVEDDLGLSYNERKIILNDLTKWFLSNEQLHIEENVLCVYDMSKWKVNGKDIIVREKDAIEAIKRGVLSRLKGIRATTSNQTSETEIDFLESWKDALEAIEGSVDREISRRIDSGELDPNNATQIADAKRDIRKDLQQDEISRFLINGLEEIRRLSQELQEMRATEILFSNFAKLMRMKADIMGFYEIVSSRYIQPYTRNTDNPEFMEGGSLYGQIKAIRNAIGSIKTVYDLQLERYADYIVDRIAEDYIDIGDKEMWANNAKLWLRNKIDGGNLSFLETVAGPAYTSTSPIVRIFDMYVREANTAVRQDVLERGKKLNKLYDECEPVIRKLFPGNFMRYFCEMDENGKPTGYFVSKYKIGTFLKRREEIRKKLLKKYNVEVDSETGELLFENEEQRIDFEDAYDLARYKLGEVRKYRPEYYIARRHALSKDTNALLSQYENQINRLKKGAMVTVEIDGKKVDVFMKNKLSPSARYDYERLRREKDALGNPYEIIFDSAGNITSIKEKEGVAKTRALEIMNWNKWQAENIQRTPNTVKFNAVREQLVEKYGEDSIEIKQFDFDYTTRRASLDWYDTLMYFAGYTNDLYEELRDKRKALLRAIEYKSGLYTNRYDFDKLNGDALEILRNLEHDLDVAKEKTERSKEEIEEIQTFFNNRTTQLLFTKNGTNIPYLDYEQKRIEELFPGDKTKLKELFYDKYFYEDKNGDVYPLSIFSQLSPSLASDIEENVPIGMFSDVDLLSTFVDDRFDPNEDSSFQIDKENKEFINDRYDEIMKDKKLKAFYEELLNTMDDAWEQLPNVYRTNRYQMPQRRDRSSHLITRLGSFKAIMSNLFKVNENDVQFNEEFTTHADGTIVETIPVRWVKALLDPTMISTDIIGSVVDFYEMALNFREKQAIAAMGEALKLQTSKTPTGEIETDQSSRLGTYLSMFVYGRMVSGFSKNKTMSNTEKVIAKCLYRLRNLAHSKLMKHNWFGVAKNLIDSTSSLLGEVYGGKHFTIGMFVKALRHMGKEILTGAAFSFGKTNTRSWTAKAMLFNGVSGTMHELFHNRNESRIRRVLQMTPMIEYTFVDYSFKGCITNMTYDSYKLVTNPSTGKKEFMNMELAKYAYSKAGVGRNAGLDAFNKSDITLRDAYNDSGYEFELKPEYFDIVRPYNKDLGRRSRKLEQRVASTIQERSGIINGMLNDIDRGKLNQNYVGALVMLMRGWMICQMADNIKYGHDFARFSSDANEFIDKKSIKKYFNRTYINSKLGLDLKDPQMTEEDEDYEGMFNLATGTVDNGAWRNLLRAYIHWAKDLRIFKINLRGLNLGNKNITSQEMYQVKKMNAAITAVGVIATLSFILGKSLEGDGDNPQWWKLALYSYMTGAISELTTKLGYAGFAPTVMDLVNSLAIAPSTVFEDFDAPLEVGSDIISLSVAAINNFSEEYGQDALKPVTSGSYSKLPYGIRGNKKIEKAIKAKDGHTPQYIKNALELSSIVPGISDLGIANIVKNLSESGLDTKSNYYIGKQFPTKYVVYAAQRSSKPKEQHGIFGVLENTGIIPKQQPRIKPPKTSNKSGRRSGRRTGRKISR